MDAVTTEHRRALQSEIVYESILHYDCLPRAFPRLYAALAHKQGRRDGIVIYMDTAVLWQPLPSPIRRAQQDYVVFMSMDLDTNFHFAALLYRAARNTVFGIDCRYYDEDSETSAAPAYAAVEAKIASQCRAAGVHYVSMDAMWRWAPLLVKGTSTAALPPTLTVPCQLLEVGAGADVVDYVKHEGMACVLWTHAILEDLLRDPVSFPEPLQWAQEWYKAHGTTARARAYIRRLMRDAWTACRTGDAEDAEVVVDAVKGGNKRTRTRRSPRGRK